MSQPIYMGTVTLNATSISRPVFIRDLVSSTGFGGKTGLVYNTAGLVLVREIFTETTPSVLGLATLSGPDAAFASGGFIELSAANMPGWYRLDFPNGSWSVAGFTAFELRGAAGMVPVRVYFDVDLMPTIVRNRVLDRVLPGNHEVTNSTSKLIQIAAAAASGAAGVGARTVTITVLDDVSNPIPGASVRMSKGAESYIGTTGGAGTVVFNVNDGTWIVAVTKSGYQFNGATLVVDGTENPVYTMEPLLLIESLPGLTTGYLTTYSQLGVPEAAVEITATVERVTDPDVFDLVGISLDKTPRTEVSDAAGLIQFTNLFKGVTYTFKRGTNPAGKTVPIPVEAGPSYQLPLIVGNP